MRSELKWVIAMSAIVTSLCFFTFIDAGSFLNLFMAGVNYSFFWYNIKCYRREKAKAWYASLIAAQKRAQFGGERMELCVGWCSSRVDYLPYDNTGYVICRYCGQVEWRGLKCT